MLARQIRLSQRTTTARTAGPNDNQVCDWVKEINQDLLKQKSLEIYNCLYPNDHKLQTLKIKELLANTQGIEVNFNTLTYEGSSEQLQGSELNCGLKIG